MDKRRIALAAILGALLLCAHEAAAAPKVGKPAPDFQGRTFDGKTVKLSDFKGQVVVVNLWATWCAPCRKELPLLDAYYRLQAPHGLRVVALATEDSVPDRYLKPVAAVVSFPLIKRLQGNYPVMTGVPTNYVIDRAGVVRYARAGAFDLDSLNEILVPLLEESAPEEGSAAAPAATQPR